uniref:TOG domain-containing protein n=1 Tax=Anopheles dirus TaxID=7168 RepID=A0A182NE41_9DIPT
MFFRRVFAKNGTTSSSSGDSASSSTTGNVNMTMHGHAMAAAGVPLESPARYRRALNVEDNHRVLSVLQLTPLWEYIIRNNELPVGLNMNELFREFLERLHDPEFQVRQHALRVLIDVIIVLRDETDIYFAPLLPPIIDNLGHPSPAVRKGALDVLKVYIAQTKLPETVMLEIMNYGMDRNPKDPLSSRYIVGVMLALPSLIQPAILTAKRTFILRAVINALGGKMVQITYQEIALKILLKIKNTIGSREFYECISVAYRRDFDLLCNVYGLPNPLKSPRRDPIVPPGEIPLGNVEMRKSWKPTVVAAPAAASPAVVPLQPLSPKAQRWKSGSHGDISRAAALSTDPTRLRHRRGSDERLPQHDYILSKGPGGGPLLRRVSLEKIDDSKVIMETEIKINKESVTMRILEAENSNSNSISEESDEDNANKRFGVVRVLTDSELEDSVTVKSIGIGSQGTTLQHHDFLQSSDTEYVRRTPRRVRFGGEIVKMRTPDSDTFDQSDQDAMTLSQASNQSSQLILSSSTASERPSSAAALPQRSSLKSASSSSDRSSTTYSNAAMRRQYSQSADTERSSPPSGLLMSSDFTSSSITSKPRPSSAKSTTMDTSYVSELNSGSDPEDNISPSMVASSVVEEADTPSAARSSARPKSSLARPKSAKTPPLDVADRHDSESKNMQQQQHPPETPDVQSRPEPEVLPLAALDASTILADKIEEVKQAIQGIESKINNVVLKKADSADGVQDQATKQSGPTPKLEPNLSLEVLMKTNSTENAENLQQDPSQTEHNEKDYTKELNIEIPKEEKLQNAPPPQRSSSPIAPSNKEGEKLTQSKPVPRIIRSGIPRLNTMPSPKSMRKVQGATHSAPKSPAESDTKGHLTPQPTTGRGRTLLRTRSASSGSMKRSVYISPSSLSPKPHSGIEIIHNLLRSPSTSPHRSRRRSSATSDKPIGMLVTASDKNNNISSVSEVDGRTDKCISVNEDDIFDVFGKTIATQTSVDELADPPFVPFCRAPSRLEQTDANGNAVASDTPADGGRDDHFLSAASPKRSQNQPIVSTWEDLGIVDRMTLYHLKSPDWRLRSQGFGGIEEALKSSDNLAKVQPYLESLLRTLLSSERNPDVIDDKVRMLVNLVSRLPLENLEDRVGQIMTGLCRQGGPGSNTVAKALMQRLPTAAIVQRLLSDDFLHAKSSKFRENALQTVLFALMTFPSTYFDIKTLISRATEAALDRKKRVRHAALDVLAVLGQISSPKLVLDVVCAAVGTRPEGNHLITAVKARLARKQLPFIGPDGSVEYAIKVPSSRSSTVIMFGADVDWIEAGSGSASPTFNRPGRHKYPSFQVENSSFDDMRQYVSEAFHTSTLLGPLLNGTNYYRKPSFKVFDEIQQPIETVKVSTSSGWTSKIPVSYSDNMGQPMVAANAPRALYGGGQSSRSYPELMDSKLPAPYGPKPGGPGANRKLEGNVSGIPQIANGKLSRNATSLSRFPEMEQKANGKTILAKNNNPYEMKPLRTRGKLYSRNSDGFMSDTIASANKQVHTEIRPATDPVVVENEGFRQSRCGMRFYNPNHIGSMFLKLVPTYHRLCGSCLGCFQRLNPCASEDDEDLTSPVTISGDANHQCSDNNNSANGADNKMSACELHSPKDGYDGAPPGDMTVSLDSDGLYGRLARTHPELVRLCQWCFFKRRKETAPPAACDDVCNRSSSDIGGRPSNSTVGCLELTEITNVVPFTNGAVFETPQKLFIPRECEGRGDGDEDRGLVVMAFPPSVISDSYGQPTTASSDVHNKQQMTTHVQNQDVDQRPNLSPSKGYNNNHNTAANGGTNVRSNSASYGEMQNYYGESNIGSGSGTAPSTPHRTRFLGAGQSVPVINQESYTIHRDENYDSDQDERSSNDSTSTRIISNSILNFRDRDRVTVGGDGPYPSSAVPSTADRNSRPPSIPSVSRPQSVSSHKSIGSGVLKQQLPDGRLSRNSNASMKTHSTGGGGGDNFSLKSNRSFTGKITSDDRIDGEWYGERASTPMHSEMDVISSNQVHYESDYDEDDEEQTTRNDDRNFMSKPATNTPKRYPTPSPHPLQGSYSTEELSNHNSYNRSDDVEDDIEQEMPISRPRSRVHSASMGNLQKLDLAEEEMDEPTMPVSPKKILKKPFLVRRSGKVAPVKEVVSGVKAKNKLNEVIFQKTMRKFEKPKDALTNCLTHLESPNWEQNISGLQFFVRLIRHHPEVIDTQIHLLSVALAKQVRNLRSQVARAACQASAEFFSTHRRCLEGEAEDIATHLLHRTADTNKFLRADATQALESMCDNVSIPKVVHIISFKGATHQNAVVRTTAAKLLNKIVQQLGCEKVFALPKETRDKLILTGAHLLLEGSLETRNYTKSVFKQLSDHPNYSKSSETTIPLGANKGGPHGLGDPDDRRLRKVELEVLIPKIMRERAKKEKCIAEVKAFEDCCQGSGLFMVAKCQEQNDAFKACSLQWYKNEQFKQECTDIYLAERREFRRTGVPKKFRKNIESDPK